MIIDMLSFNSLSKKYYMGDAFMEKKTVEKRTDSPARVASKYYMPKKEIRIYAFGALGQGMIYATMSSYISDFYISVLQLPLLFVLLLMLIARVWDAINDPIMGMIVDRYKTRWGKMKPYIIFTAVPIAIFTFLMFFDPGLKGSSLMVYAALVYVIWGMIYTASDVPFWSLPNVMTPNPDERQKTISFGRTLNGIGTGATIGLFLALGLIVPRVFDDLSAIEMNKRKYMLLAVIVSAIGIALFVNSYFHIKERVLIPRKTKRDAGERSTLSRILHCKPLMLVTLMGVLSCGRYMIQAAAIHVARYALYIGPEIKDGISLAERTAYVEKSIGAVNTIFMACAAVGMFGAMLFMPLLYKKFNNKQIVIFTCVAGFAASLLTTLVGVGNILGWFNNIYACIPFLIISSIPMGVLNIAAYAMIGDSLDYMEWKTGYRDTALGSACQSFVNKLGNALATTVIVLMYIIISLEPSDMLSSEVVKAAYELATTQRLAMFSLISIVPGISLLLCAIPIFFYDIVGAKKDKITAELAEQRKAKGIVIE
jgi:Na+/melibiose symporter-like transporter